MTSPSEIPARVILALGDPKPETKLCRVCGPRKGSQFRVRAGGRLASVCKRCTRRARLTSQNQP